MIVVGTLNAKMTSISDTITSDESRVWSRTKSSSIIPAVVAKARSAHLGTVANVGRKLLHSR